MWCVARLNCRSSCLEGIEAGKQWQWPPVVCDFGETLREFQEQTCFFHDEYHHQYFTLGLSLKLTLKLLHIPIRVAAHVGSVTSFVRSENIKYQTRDVWVSLSREREIERATLFFVIGQRITQNEKCKKGILQYILYKNHKWRILTE